MPKFEYRAISPSGEKITGIHESKSKFEILMDNLVEILASIID